MVGFLFFFLMLDNLLSRLFALNTNYIRRLMEHLEGSLRLNGLRATWRRGYTVGKLNTTFAVLGFPPVLIMLQQSSY